MNKLTFIMESTSFTNLVYNNILSYQKSIGRANEGPHYPRVKKGEEAALSKTTLSSQKTTFSQTKPQVKRQEEEKDQSFVTPKHSLRNSMKTVKSP